MTPDEIRQGLGSSRDAKTACLAEIAAQLAEINEKLRDYFTIQITDEVEKLER
jgi:hypothetical protein